MRLNSSCTSRLCDRVTSQAGSPPDQCAAWGLPCITHLQQPVLCAVLGVAPYVDDGVLTRPLSGSPAGASPCIAHLHQTAVCTLLVVAPTYVTQCSQARCQTPLQMRCPVSPICTRLWCVRCLWLHPTYITECSHALCHTAPQVSRPASPICSPLWYVRCLCLHSV